MDKIPIFPDHIADALARPLAKFLPELFASSPSLRAEYQEWLKTPEGARYAEPMEKVTAHVYPDSCYSGPSPAAPGNRCHACNL